MPPVGVIDRDTHERSSGEGLPPVGSTEERSANVAGNAGPGAP